MAGRKGGQPASLPRSGGWEAERQELSGRGHCMWQRSSGAAWRPWHTGTVPTGKKTARLGQISQGGNWGVLRHERPTPIALGGATGGAVGAGVTGETIDPTAEVIHLVKNCQAALGTKLFLEGTQHCLSPNARAYSDCFG